LASALIAAKGSREMIMQKLREHLKESHKDRTRTVGGES
jgi:hypothetical protein